MLQPNTYDLYIQGLRDQKGDQKVEKELQRPNTIQGLRELKVEKENQKNQSDKMSNSLTSFHEDTLNKTGSLKTDNPYNLLIQNKEDIQRIIIIQNNIKQVVESKIEDIRNWRDQQQKQHKQQLDNNQNELQKQLNEFQSKENKEEFMFKQYLSTVDKQNSYSDYINEVNKKQIKQDEDSYKKFQKTDETTKQIKESYYKVENLGNLNNVMEDALNQLAIENTGVQQKIMKELNIKENEYSIKEQQNEHIFNDLNDWNAQLNSLLSQSDQLNFGDFTNKTSFSSNQFQTDIEEINKQFADLDKILKNQK